ncbi:heterokaryon incompatibility protein-domain-containing protein [Staphylotrichum tortipilum]|uniref:Heterokaryon incompatibility protein-domain-containing protein n=1 Tax=Staphylotrichum tortipilum TaxID=2831512 RepID=A0AAN6MBY0_9PEZI|nr:heterokaryon incompatibility protein-domain-containing protein [Staphylotrichum longicolle]
MRSASCSLTLAAATNSIHCFLENYPVAKSKKFAALSYVWGDNTPSTCRLIFLDGYPVTVTASLYAFLSQHRAPEICRVLWTDALCINEADLSERASQIRLMKYIYETASHVVIWLGPSTPFIVLAIPSLLSIHNTWWPPILARTGSPHRSLKTLTPSDIASIPYPWPPQGLSEILTRPWWSRIWVYQESTEPTPSPS